MRFQKYPFSTRRKRSKMFSSTLAFSYRFHLSTLKQSATTKTIEITWDCACVNITRPSAILDRRSDLDWNRWHVTLFMSPFSKVSVSSTLSTLETERFQNDAFSNVSTFETVFENLRFHGRFRAF